MRFRFIPALLLVLSACASSGEIPPAAPEAVGLSSEKLRKIGPVMNGMIDRKKLAGAIVAVARNGRLAFLECYGKSDLESGRPMTPDTIFRIYSMSKGITSAAILMLAEEGTLAVDDPASKLVPELKDVKVLMAEGARAPSRPPTIKDLLLHTAGYSYGGGARPADKVYATIKPMEAKGMDEFAARLASLPLGFDPGKDWVYSISIDILGLIVQRASGRPLGRFLEERIFKPLGMTDTGFSVPPEKLGRFAANYQREKDGLKLLDAPATSKYLQPPALESGGGGLVSTAHDFLRFMLMIEAGGTLDGVRILREESVKLMTTNQLPPEAFPIYFGKQVRHGTGFGLGFNVRTQDTAWDPQARVGEYGWGGAASTHYWTSPKDRLVVVTLEQTMPYSFDTEFAVKGLIYDAILK